MLVYRQSPPALFIDGRQLRGEPLYSGHGDGLNNPKLEALPDLGPIPAGLWSIEQWLDHYKDKGPVVAILKPLHHDALGRSGFLIHGDNPQANHSASDGCIVAARELRDALRASGQTVLQVIRC